MKKPVLMVLALAAGVAGWAQRPVGDTLRILDTTYYCHPRDIRYNDGQCTAAVCLWHLRSLTASDYYQPYGSYSREDLGGGMSGLHSRMWAGNGTVGRQMETDKPLKVVGIAAPVWMEPGRVVSDGINYHYDYYSVHDTLLSTRLTDSMALYKVTPNGLIELASAGWRMDAPHRTMVFSHFLISDDGLDQAEAWKPDHEYTRNMKIPLYEVMFKEPVIVEDSFVVAGIAMNNEGHFEEHPYDKTKLFWAFDHNPTRYLMHIYKVDSLSDARYNGRYLIGWSKFRNYLWTLKKREGVRGFVDIRNNHQIVHAQFEWPLVFPIIELGFDTALCHDVSGLRVAELGAGQATLMWDSGDGGPWEVAIGKVTDPWESYTITTTTVPMATVTGLQRGVQYFALVRGYCSLTEEYGQWSEPVEVEVFQDPEPEGIGREAVEDGMTYMVPNPTSGVTNVMSSYRMQRIAVYDTKGTKVHEQEVDGIAAKVDASAWPKGVYIVAMYLDHGVKTRRLVVQ